MQCCTELGAQYVIMDGNSQSVIDAFLSKEVGFSPFNLILDDVSNLASKFSSLSYDMASLKLPLV